MAGRRTTRDLLSVLLLVLALLAFAWNFWTMPPSINKSLHSDIARNLAAESLKLLKSGGRITIIARETDAFPQPAMKLLVSEVVTRFEQAGAPVRSIEAIQLDPIRPSEVPPGDFYELLRRAPAQDVILSLLGPPVLLPDQHAKLGRPKASVVALCTGNLAESVSLPELFNAGLLHAAIINKPPVSPSSREASAPGETFDRLYTVIRADTAPSQTGPL